MLEDFSGYKLPFNDISYPSKLENHVTGTIIKFKTSREMYNSIGKYGTKDARSIALYLKEDLGFIYAGIIKESLAQIQIVINSGDKLIVNAVEPWVERTILPGVGKSVQDLGLLAGKDSTGKLTISYEFYIIKNREVINSDEKVLYYQANMKSSGVEIRINGRMIKNNLLTDIWDTYEQHNRFNNFLVKIDLITNDRNTLPATRSSKNGFRQGDFKLLGLFKWIKTHCGSPVENKNNRDEIHLFEDLRISKLKHLSDVVEGGLLTVETNRKVLNYSSEPAKIDLFIAFANKTIIYTGKKGNSTAIDLYKLKFYWDACLIDGITPTSAILLSPEHNSTMHDLVAINNSLKDFEGNFYKFSLRTWQDEGIDYPPRTM